MQAALYDVKALMEQGRQYNGDTKIAMEVATLAVRDCGGTVGVATPRVTDEVVCALLTAACVLG